MSFLGAKEEYEKSTLHVQISISMSCIYTVYIYISCWCFVLIVFLFGREVLQVPRPHLMALPQKTTCCLAEVAQKIPTWGDAYEGQGERWLIPPALCLRTVQCHGEIPSRLALVGGCGRVESESTHGFQISSSHTLNEIMYVHFKKLNRLLCVITSFVEDLLVALAG